MSNVIFDHATEDVYVDGVYINPIFKFASLEYDGEEFAIVFKVSPDNILELNKPASD